MEFLQKRFFYQTKFKSSPIVKTQKNSGFVSILLLPFIALMMTAIIGFSSLSLGIKNITKAQSYCIKANLKGQKELGILLKRIVQLNAKVLFFHKTRTALEASLVTATVSGLVNLLPILKKNLDMVKQTQKNLIIKQKYLLTNSLLVKRKTFKNLKKQFQKLNISNVKELTFYKKALALEKKKVGDKAYTYKPVPDFTRHQKSQFYWKMRPFFPLDNNWQLFRKTKQKDFSGYKCTASLKKKGETWISTLYH